MMHQYRDHGIQLHLGEEEPVIFVSSQPGLEVDMY
jgi:hypothetical protein